MLMNNPPMIRPGARWWKRATIAGLVMLLALAGCASGTTAGEATLTAAPTVRPSLTPPATITPLPPTLTPLPTLAPEEAQAYVLELLETNGGCELPCWWGFIPGDTSWETIHDLLRKLDGDLYIAHMSENEFFAAPRIPLPKNVIDTYPSYIYWFRNGILHAIEIFDYFDTPKFKFIDIVNHYGEPSEIGIRTYKTEYNGGMPIDLMLFYDEIGLAIEYRTWGQLNGEKVSGCFIQAKKPFIWAWDPDWPITFFEAGDYFGWGIERWPFIFLEDAVGVRVSDFVVPIISMSDDACLETPANLWPVQ